MCFELGFDSDSHHLPDVHPRFFMVLPWGRDSQEAMLLYPSFCQTRGFYDLKEICAQACCFVWII